MGTVQTPFGDFSVSWVTQGTPEIHVSHSGLEEHSTALEKILATLGGRTLKLTDTHWTILVDRTPTEKLAMGYLNAAAELANTIAKQNAKAMQS